MAIIPSDSKILILDFDGVMTHLKIDWDAVRSRLALKLKQPANTTVSAAYQFARHTHQTSLYLDTIKHFEHDALETAPLSPLMKEIVATKIYYNVVSNSLHSTIVSYNRIHGLTGLCRKIVAADDVANLKPHPEGLLKIIGKDDPANYLFIGDQLSDEAAANQAKINFMRYIF